MNRLRKIGLLLPAAVLMSACAGLPSAPHVELPQQYRMPQAPLAATFERRIGRIALLDTDGNVVIMDQTGGNVVKITTDADGATNTQNASTKALATTYRYPVWSPDASQIAFVQTTAMRSTTSRVIEYGADSVTVERGQQSVTVQQSADGSSASRDPDTVSVERSPSRVIIERSSGGNI